MRVISSSSSGAPVLISQVIVGRVLEGSSVCALQIFDDQFVRC